MPKLCAEAGFLLSSTPGLREEVHGLGSFLRRLRSIRDYVLCKKLWATTWNIKHVSDCEMHLITVVVRGTGVCAFRHASGTSKSYRLGLGNQDTAKDNLPAANLALLQASRFHYS